MANVKELRTVIEKSGYKYGFIAEQLGLSRGGLWKKMNNESEFTVKELTILIRLLNLESSQVDDIFLS